MTPAFMGITHDIARMFRRSYGHCGYIAVTLSASCVICCLLKKNFGWQIANCYPILFPLSTIIRGELRLFDR